MPFSLVRRRTYHDDCDDIDGNDDEREYEEHEDDDAGAATRARCEGGRATRSERSRALGALGGGIAIVASSLATRGAHVRRARVRMGGDL